MKKFILLTLLTLLFAAGPVGYLIAGHHYHGYGYGMNMKNMSEMDENQDNLLTFDEFSTPHVNVLRNYFKMMDTNNDELISDVEWNEFIKIHTSGDDLKG